MNDFAEAPLLESIKDLPTVAQSAFAKACATRIKYLDAPPLAEEAQLLCVQALAHARRFIEEGGLNRSAIEALRSTMESSSDLDDDRVAACAYVLDHLLSHDAQQVVWAARRSYEACDSLAQEWLAIHSSSETVKRKLFERPVVQAELKLQEADMAELRGNTTAPLEIVDRASGCRRP